VSQEYLATVSSVVARGGGAHNDMGMPGSLTSDTKALLGAKEEAGKTHAENAEDHPDLYHDKSSILWRSKKEMREEKEELAKFQRRMRRKKALEQMPKVYVYIYIHVSSLYIYIYTCVLVIYIYIYPRLTLTFLVGQPHALV
jgi:hypothetical protein